MEGEVWQWEGRVERIGTGERGRYFRVDGVQVAVDEIFIGKGEWQWVEVGDRVKVEGNLRRGKYSWWLENQKMEILELRGLMRIKLLERVEREWLGPTGWLINGMVLGEKSGFEKVYWEKLRLAGLTHIVVASGFNVALVGGVLVGGLAWVWGRKWSFLIGIGIVWAYAGLAGAEAPVVRAAGMVSLVYLAGILGREARGNWILGAVGTVMILIKPEWIVSVSFWLSILATWAVGPAYSVAREGRLGKLMEKIPVLGEILLQTALVYLWVGPVLALVFGEIGWGGLIANLLVLPVVPAATVVAGMGLGLGQIWWGAGRVVVWLAYPYFWWIDQVVEVVGAWKLISPVYINGWMLAGYYLILVFLTERMKKTEVKG